MARDQRKRSVRRDPGLREGSRPVRLNVSRRFQTAQGNDKAVREARALSSLFESGTALYKDIQIKRNEEGGQQAIFESAQGGVRDSENTNKGYMEMWDQIEAKNDLHRFTKELPEILRGADWENLTEDEAQGIIDGYFEDQLKGINPQSVYGQMVAEGIFAQNAELIETHKAFQLERFKQEQRVLIMEEAGVSYENDGVVNYEQLMERTGIAFDGDEKMEYWINILEELAVHYEDETIITGAPERFPSGDPSGVHNDPRYAGRVRQAINKAVAAREATERREAAAAEAARKARIEATKVGIYSEYVLNGIDPTTEAITQMTQGNLEADDFAAITSAHRNVRDDRAKHGFDPVFLASTQAQISLDPSAPSVSVESLYNSWSLGKYGPPQSPDAQAALRQDLEDREQALDRKQRIASDPRKKVWVGRFNESFPVPKDQFGIPVPGPLTELRAAYSAEFELAILAAGPEQYPEIYEKFAKRYKEQETLVTAQTSSRSPKATLNNLVRGNFTSEQAAAHARTNGWTVEYLVEMRRTGELGDKKLFEPGTPHFENFKALLEELSTQ